MINLKDSATLLTTHTVTFIVIFVIIDFQSKYYTENVLWLYSSPPFSVDNAWLVEGTNYE